MHSIIIYVFNAYYHIPTTQAPYDKFLYMQLRCIELEQQSQAKSFFDSHSKQWQLAVQSGAGALQQRHNYVINLITKYFPNGLDRFLDCGCGSGELVIEAASTAKYAHGIDFAQSMIDKCIQQKDKIKRWPITREPMSQF